MSYTKRIKTEIESELNTNHRLLTPEINNEKLKKLSKQLISKIGITTTKRSIVSNLPSSGIVDSYRLILLLSYRLLVNLHMLKILEEVKSLRLYLRLLRNPEDFI